VVPGAARSTNSSALSSRRDRRGSHVPSCPTVTVRGVTINREAWLVEGPRGRRCCYELLADRLTEGPAWRDAWLERGLRPTEMATELTELVGTAPAELVGAGLSGERLERRLLVGLDMAVTFAAYWQEPDWVDRALALPEVRTALAPFAAALAAVSPRWWSAPVDLAGQRTVEFLDRYATTVSLSGAADKLAAWRADTVREERRAAVERPRDVRANVSGAWWSAPCLAQLAVTTRQPPGFGPAGLLFVEDEMGWTSARCTPVAVAGEPEVYEVNGPDDWGGLVERYPLEVTWSRRHDWWRATGVDGRWLIPDYLAISRDYTGVHLTARGYLTAAGAPLAVGSAHTVLAGWGPDQTYWLTDCLARSGPPERWRRDPNEDGLGWTRT
jgi:hypothetical protein